MRMVTSEPSSFGGSAKMTPSPPTPKLRSHARAACSGVSDGALPRRSSTCTEMAHAASAGHARGHTRVARGANSRLLPFCCPEPCHTTHPCLAGSRSRTRCSCGRPRPRGVIPAGTHITAGARTPNTRPRAARRARAGGRAGGRTSTKSLPRPWYLRKARDSAAERGAERRSDARAHAGGRARDDMASRQQGRSGAQPHH